MFLQFYSLHESKEQWLSASEDVNKFYAAHYIYIPSIYYHRHITHSVLEPLEIDSERMNTGYYAIG